MDFDDEKSLCQLQQVFISFDMMEGLNVDLSVSSVIVYALKEKLGSSSQGGLQKTEMHMQHEWIVWKGNENHRGSAQHMFRIRWIQSKTNEILTTKK